MSNNIYGASVYQQTVAGWQKQAQSKTSAGKTDANGKTPSNIAERNDFLHVSETTGGNISSTTGKTDILESSWSAITAAKAAIPTVHKSYGYTIGDVTLSDDAAKYYDKLKAKFGNMDFILVSKDMKEQVAKNASSYGNANKMVVLIDEEKLERMAMDESFRKKYEGIISMAQNQLSGMKNQFASSGAKVKNFGISVDENGKLDYFAVLDKSRAAQRERIEKSAQEKAAKKKLEKKQAEKKAQKEALEKYQKKNRSEETEPEDVEYVEYRSADLNQLLTKVQNVAYTYSANAVMTKQERAVGGLFDFKG